MAEETRWHRHWEIKVHTKGRIYRFLRKPRWFTTNEAKVDKSRLVWRGFIVKEMGDTRAKATFIYGLSLLGVLHGLTGVVLCFPDNEV